MEHVSLVIGDELIKDGGEGNGETLDPATNEVIATYARASVEQADAAVEAARESFDRGVWRKQRPVDRARVLFGIADGLLKRRDELARKITLDSGKPLRDAYYEVDCAARFFEFYAGLTDKHHGRSIPLGSGWMDWTIQDPIGVSLHIVPWNYQLLVAVRGVAPALAAGCSVVIKPSTETPMGVQELIEIARNAGLPAGVINFVPGSGSLIGDHLARHKDIDQITFTGSVTAGQRVMVAASTNAVPTVMELGGKSPQILYADADQERSLDTIYGGMFTHAGQVCNAGTRLLVESSILEETVERLHSRINSISLGHGLDDPDMGPVVSAAQCRDVNSYYELAAEEGTLLRASELPTDERLSKGNFVQPALVHGVNNRSRIAQEEVFGPLLTVIGFDTEDEALAMANDSDFGLVAGVFTSDVGKSMRAAEEIQAGQIYVNSFGIGLDVEFPFGGFKRSGFGREKGVEGMAAYLQIKNVLVGY